LLYTDQIDLFESIRQSQRLIWWLISFILLVYNVWELTGNLQIFHSQFATYNDFDDDAVVDVKKPTGLSNCSVSCKVSQFIKANRKKLKVLKLRFY